MRTPPIIPTIEGQAVGLIAGKKQASAFIGVCIRTLDGYVDSGRLKVIRHSKRKLFFRPSDLVRAVEEIGADYEAQTVRGDHA